MLPCALRKAANGLSPGSVFPLRLQPVFGMLHIKTELPFIHFNGWQGAWNFEVQKRTRLALPFLGKRNALRPQAPECGERSGVLISLGREARQRSARQSRAAAPMIQNL